MIAALGRESRTPPSKKHISASLKGIFKETDGKPLARVTALQLMLIAACGFTVRLLFMMEAHKVVLFNTLISDGESYFRWAQRIAGGDWLGTGVFYQAPLYPYFLAAITPITRSDLWSIRLLQAGIEGLSCGLLYLGGCYYFSRGIGLFAGLILALYAPGIFLGVLIQKTVLDTLWLTSLLALTGWHLHKPTSYKAGMIGTITGLFCLTRENALVLIPVLMVCILLQNRGSILRTKILHAALFLAGAALILFPVGFRNYAVGGEFALTTAQAGPNFYIGNNPAATGTYMELKPGHSSPLYEQRDAAVLAEQAVGRKLSSLEVNHYWFDKSWQFISEHPGQWMSLLGRKFLLVINSFEICDAEDYYFYQEFSPLLKLLGAFGHMGILFPAAVVGMALTWHRRRKMIPLYAMLLTFIVTTAFFYIFARYRFPLAPIFALFAAAACPEVMERMRAKRIRPLLVALVVCAIAAFLANPPMYGKQSQFPAMYANCSAIQVQNGDYADAIENAKKAMALSPNLDISYENCADALRRSGKLEDAVDTLKQGLSRLPDAFNLETNLSFLLIKLGRTAEARTWVDRALEIAKLDPPALNQLGLVLLYENKNSESINILRQSVAMAPENRALAMNLAWALAVCPDSNLRNGSEAIRLAEALRKDSPLECDEMDVLEVLAAAYAETGRFSDAANAARQAHHLAVKRRWPDPLVSVKVDKARLYESGRPYRVLSAGNP
jgi:tetratricopeptide (TPR) repeat protein